MNLFLQQLSAEFQREVRQKKTSSTSRDQYSHVYQCQRMSSNVRCRAEHRHLKIVRSYLEQVTKTVQSRQEQDQR